MKTIIASFATAALLMASSNAAIYQALNAITGDGTADALFQNTDDSLLDGGIAAIGYFNVGYGGDLTDLSAINNHINNFNIQHSAIVGSLGDNLLGAAQPGYIQDFTGLDTANITGADPLIGQLMYVFVGNAATLGASTSWALKAIATIQDDVPNEQTYLANPFGGAAPLIGSVGSFTGNASGIAPNGVNEVYTTLKLEAVPEPSAALLGLLGSLLLLRRRRA